MLSPAARHRQETLARLAVEQAPTGLAGERPTEGPAASEYELLLVGLGSDLNRLREIQSIEGKIALKRELIAAYDTHVDATLLAGVETGQALQDAIVATMMVWRFDIGDFQRGLDLAAHVLHFGLAMPQNISRTPGTMIAEVVAEAALSADRDGKLFDLATLDRTMKLTENEDMPDQVRAKLFKARGRILRRISETVHEDASAPAGAVQSAQQGALEALRRALQLDQNCGVKKDIERLEAKASAASK